jgi:hypothetical protein
MRPVSTGVLERYRPGPLVSKVPEWNLQRLNVMCVLYSCTETLRLYHYVSVLLCYSAINYESGFCKFNITVIAVLICKRSKTLNVLITKGHVCM